MLLCCFREPKKSSPTSTSALTKDGFQEPLKADAYRKSSQRPLNLSLSSGKEDDISEILVVHQHNHHKPYSHPRGHSICSLTSDRSSRPPSRDGSDRRTEARAPLPAKEAKRLKKQKSQESFKENYKSVTSIPYIDATPPSSTGIGLGLTNSVTPSHRPYPAASAGWATPVTSPNTISTPNLPTSTPVHQAYCSSAAPRPSAGIPSETSLTSGSLLNGSSNQLAKAEEKIQGRGMSRSHASYGIQQLLQEQISREEKENQAKVVEREVKAAVSKVTAAYEERLSSARAEHSLKIQQVLRDKTTSVNNARNTFETELKRQLATFEKDLHELKSQHNTEMQTMECNYTRQIREQHEKHQEIIAQYEARDEAWQNEKEEVLGEIQRLKEEANRFISILSAEDDPEKADELLSPGKRQSLTREVESLQLVVEMRTAELHKLREERTRHLQQLEELERTSDLLEKANARVEDLTVQLAAKTELERQLSWEKSQLENFFETESKNKSRISMQVEELQWRIKHNKELPPPKVYSPPSNPTSPTSNLNENQMKSSTATTTSLPTIVMNNGTKPESEKRGHEEAEIRLQRPNNIEGIEPHNLEVPTSKASIRSTSEDSLEQQCKDYNENGLEEVEGENEVQEDLSKDSDEEDEGDEGLGDIASEASNSPQPPLSLSNNNSCVVVNNTSQQQQQQKNKNNNYSLPTSPCDERVPSRIPFQAKKHQSQTNL